LQAVLAKTLTPERLIKIAVAGVARTPKLLQCDPGTIYSALHTAGQLGLEPFTPLGHAHLVPFWNGKAKRMEAQFIPGWQGLVDLARRSGHVSIIYAYAVRKGDDFDYCLGLNPNLTHRPVAGPEPDGSNLTHVYAVAKMRDGAAQFVCLTREEVEKAKLKSLSKDREGNVFGPWADHYESMALKTAVKRLCKYLPMSIDLAKAIEHDDKVEMGAHNLVIDSITGEIQSEAPKTQSRTEAMKAKLKQQAAVVVEPPPELPAGDDEDLSFDGQIDDLIPENKPTNAVKAIQGA
jgi:recombination protein RecT